MAELERVLAQLDVDWPATPSFVYQRRRRLVLPIAVAIVVAVAVAFAVPDSRGAILRFFHLGGETIEQVDTLPPAERRPVERALGEPVTPAAAAELLGRPFAVEGVDVFRSGRSVSAIVDGDLLLTETRTGNDPGVIKKFVSGQARVQAVRLDADTSAIWVHGRHAVSDPPLPARLAGNTLVWLRDAITYRLEGRGLTLARATALARRLR
jgi:hypothetical protein